MSVKILRCLACAVALATGVALAGEINFIKDDERPAIWRDAPGQDVVSAETVARLDGWAKLAEYVGGMEVKGVTSVSDMVDASQNLTGFMQTRLKNMAAEEYVHYDNGVVQCKVSAKLSDLVESIEKYLNEEKVNDKTVSREAFRKYNLDSEDRVLTVWGNGALKGSEGVKIVQALRAAELSALEQMIALLEGVQIGRETKVKDFVLASDLIKACINDFAKGIRYVDYRVRSNTVEVDASIKFVTVIERIERIYEEIATTDLCTGCPTVEKKEFEEVTQREEETIHKTTGRAAIATGKAMDAGIAKPASLSEPLSRDAKVRVIRREVVTEKVKTSGVGL